jgi:hypothetical protein
MGNLMATLKDPNAALSATAISSETSKELCSEICALHKDLEQSRDEHNYMHKDLANVCRELNNVYRKYKNADKKADHMHHHYDNLKETSKCDQESITTLQQQIEALEHRQLTCCRKIMQSSNSLCTPQCTTSATSHLSRPLSGTFPLLLWLVVPTHPTSAPALTTASATSSPLLLRDLPPPSSLEASPVMHISLLTHMTDDTPEDTPDAITPMISSLPYAEHVGFYSLLLVLIVTNELFLFFSHFWHVFSDDSLVITRSCTITKLRLLMIQSLTDIISDAY